MAVKSAGDRQTQLKTGIIDDLQPFRIFYANLVAANAKIINPQSRVRDAFASTPRERFVGAGPWQVYTASGYIETPTDDPRLLYQDVLIALKTESKINNGQPTLHALCMEALQVKPGESIVHVGAGTGYYTALLAHLTGAEGEVFAYEIDSDLAQRAAANLAGISNVTVYPRSAWKVRYRLATLFM